MAWLSYKGVPPTRGSYSRQRFSVKGLDLRADPALSTLCDVYPYEMEGGVMLIIGDFED